MMNVRKMYNMIATNPFLFGEIVQRRKTSKGLHAHECSL